MRHLRPTAIAGLLLAAATLSSCGFDYPTDRVNTIGAGVNDRDASMDALGIRVLASAEGQGRLIGTLVNNNTEEESLDAISAPDGELEAPSFKPIEVAGRRSVNLAEEQIPLTGEFTAGRFVPMELEFSTGETVSLEVPVVKPCFQYSDIPEATVRPSKSKSKSPTESVTEQPTSTEDSDLAEEEHADATFTCADELEAPGGHGGGGH